MNKDFEKWWDDQSPAVRVSNTKYQFQRTWQAAESSSAAKIAELEADCKAMARGLDIAHGLQCDCPACIIAGKYREGK